MFKMCVLSLMFLLLNSCGPVERKEYSCLKCASVAMKITFYDQESLDIVKSLSLNIIDPEGNSRIITHDENYSDEEAFVVYGGPGVYRIQVSSEEYINFEIDDIIVGQYPDVTCKHAHTEHLEIEIIRKNNEDDEEQFNIKKNENDGDNESFKIIDQFTMGSC